MMFFMAVIVNGLVDIEVPTPAKIDEQSGLNKVQEFI